MTAWRVLGALLGIVALSCDAARTDPVTVDRWVAEEVVGEMAGTEDLALYRSADGVEHVLISAQDRRRDAPGAIWDLAPGSAPERLFEDADGEPLRPHGIAVARLEHDGIARLFVVHHRPEGRRPRHAVVVFRLDGDSPGWERTLTSRRLPSPNDLVATPSGDLYVSNEITGRGVVRQALEFFRVMLSSFVAHTRYAPGATAEWRVAASGPRYANGVEVDADHLYVAATLDRELWIFERDSHSGAVGEVVERVAVGSGIDNLTWGEEDGQRSLYTAAHPDLRRFLRHAKSAEGAAPSEVWRFDASDSPGAASRAERVFEDGEGRHAAAAATALLVGDELYLGQVFERGVVRLRRASSGG